MTMQPPVHTIVLPMEVCEFLMEVLTHKRSGAFTLHIVGGVIRKQEMRDVRGIGEKRLTNPP